MSDVSLSTRERGPQWRPDILDDWRVDLADAICREIARRNLSTAQVAKLCRYTDETAVRLNLGRMRDRFKQGEAEPGITTLLRYAHYLKVPLARRIVAEQVAA